MMYSMTLPDKLRAAARRPDNWDVEGLLLDAADRICLADQVSKSNTCERREVIPGWTLEEILCREG